MASPYIEEAARRAAAVPSHTPGPWRVVREENLTGGFDAIVREPRGWRIADIHTGPVSQEANAHLIAAAPDLLAAGVNLVSQHDAAFRSPDYCQCTQCAPFRAAIAKATQP